MTERDQRAADLARSFNEWTPPTEQEKRVGAALRDECQAIFGSCWSWNVAWRLARAAIRAHGEGTPRTSTEGGLGTWTVHEWPDDPAEGI
jgi:hypothetical protein